MKTRKWLYLTSLAGAALNFGLYKPLAMEKLIQVLRAPTGVIAFAVLVGLAYLLFQYILLLIQLASSYDIILRERFVHRRAADMEKLASSAREGARIWRDARRQAASRGISPTDIATQPAVVEAQSDLDDLRGRMAELRGLNPGNRRLYRWTEAAVDALRLLVAPIVAGAVIAHMVVG